METLNLEISPTNILPDYTYGKCLFYSICQVSLDIHVFDTFTLCKEIVLNYISEYYKEGGETSDLKLIIHVDSNFEEKSKQITKVIDMFSSINNWGKTNIYKTIRKNIYIVDLPKQWFNYPQLISIITLIIASCYSYKITKDETIESFINNIKDGIWGNEEYMSLFYPPLDWIDIMPLVMNNYEYLFNGEDPEYYYDYNLCAHNDSYIHLSRSGIKSLCQYKSLSKTLNDKLIHLKRER